MEPDEPTVAALCDNISYGTPPQKHDICSKMPIISLAIILAAVRVGGNNEIH